MTTKTKGAQRHRLYTTVEYKTSRRFLNKMTPLCRVERVYDGEAIFLRAYDLAGKVRVTVSLPLPKDPAAWVRKGPSRRDVQAVAAAYLCLTTKETH